MMHFIERVRFGRFGLRQRFLWIYDEPCDSADKRQSGRNQERSPPAIAHGDPWRKGTSQRTAYLSAHVHETGYRSSRWSGNIGSD